MSEESAKNAILSDPIWEHKPSEELHESVKKLEAENTQLQVMVSRLEEETLTLKEMLSKASNELSGLKAPALLVARVSTVIGDKAVIRIPNGNEFFSFLSSEARDVHCGDSVLVEQKSLNIIKKVDVADNDVEKFVIIESPKESWKDIGGLSKEIREVKEVIELPLKNPKLFRKIGIEPPKGVLLYGPPGTGKTLLAKAVAHSTKATFIQVVGSELVQKFIGEGAKLVKEIFNMARAKAPAIVFIDEIDAVAATRMENGTSGEREVNRTFVQLLAELDGFKPLDNVKVIAATNRLDILDKAITRPGRLDRLIEVGLPDAMSRLEIFNVHSRSMNMKEVKADHVAEAMEDFSGAEIKAVCTEAGYCAIREERDHVVHHDFLQAVDKIRGEVEDEDDGRFFG